MGGARRAGADASGFGAGVMASERANLELLRAAIARRAGVVLSLPTLTSDAPGEGSLKHYKSRFLADGGDGLWVAAVPADPAVIRELVDRRAPAGVSFRSGHLKVMFAARVLHAQDDYPTAELSGAAPEARGALLLRFPDAHEVRAVQRRKTFRVPVPPGSDLKLRLWVITEDVHLREKPPPRSELPAELVDVSVAGAGVMIRGNGGKPPTISQGDRLRLELSLRESAVLLEGRVCYPPRAVKDGQGAVRAGVQFKTLTDSKDDRNARFQLDRIVSDLQRESIRRRKLGAA